MYSIIKTGGKQYRVQVGDELNVEKIDADQGSTIDINEVLLIGDGENFEIGKPFIENAKVEAEVIEHGKDKKVIIFKFKPKKDYRKKRGHRQPYTKIKILKIQGQKLFADEPPEEPVENTETVKIETTEVPETIESIETPESSEKVTEESVTETVEELTNEVSNAEEESDDIIIDVAKTQE